MHVLQLMSNHKYKYPPIEEAVCEFRFNPMQDWDPTISGKLHKKINKKYPGKPRLQKRMETMLTGAVGGRAQIKLESAFPKTLLLTNDESRMISVGHDVLSVHMFKPYTSWEQDFRNRIEEVIDAYQKVSDPLAVVRIGVRYINRILIPDGKVHLGKYFRFNPAFAADLPKKLSNFLSRNEYNYDDGIKLTLTYASTAAPEGRAGVLLDLDVNTEIKEGKSVDEVMTIVDDLHMREGKAFEALVTDEARGLFDAD